jgi:hypothetical protein
VAPGIAQRFIPVVTRRIGQDGSRDFVWSASSGFVAELSSKPVMFSIQWSSKAWQGAATACRSARAAGRSTQISRW